MYFRAHAIETEFQLVRQMSAMQSCRHSVGQASWSCYMTSRSGRLHLPSNRSNTLERMVADYSGLCMRRNHSIDLPRSGSDLQEA